VQVGANLEAKDNVGPHAQGDIVPIWEGAEREGTQDVPGYVVFVFGLCAGVLYVCECLCCV